MLLIIQLNMFQYVYFALRISSKYRSKLNSIKREFHTKKFVENFMFFFGIISEPKLPQNKKINI